MKKLLQNAFESFYSSIIGSVAGIAEIRQGIETHDSTQIIVGVGLLLLGLFTKEK